MDANIWKTKFSAHFLKINNPKHMVIPHICDKQSGNETFCLYSYFLLFLNKLQAH